MSAIILKNRKMMKSGNRYLITMPSKYIQDGILNPDIEYDIELRPIKEIAEVKT